MPDTTDARDYLRSDQWPVGTQVQLLSVPWDNAYRDVVAWSSAEERDAWFEAQEATFPVDTTYNFLRPGEPIAIKIPYSTAYRYNYVCVTNPAQPVDDEGPVRMYCYFVTGMEYLSPQATNIYVQLDVMTTYAGQINLGRAFVERGHIALANENARTSGHITGKLLNDYLTLPEGLDVGQQYVPCFRERIPVGSGGGDGQAPKIIIISTANLAADPGTINEPNLNVANGQDADGLPSGCNVYWVDTQNFDSFMAAMQDKSWVAQCIVSIYTFPGRLLSAGPAVELFGNSGVVLHFIGETDSFTPESTEYWACEEFDTALANGLGTDADLTKLYSYPYSVIEMTSYDGNPVFLKPQLIGGDHLSIYYLACALAPFARAGFFARNYGAPDGMNDIEYQYWGFAQDFSEPTAPTYLIPAGDFLDSCVWLSDFPQFSIVNSSYITYMASTARTRDYQYQSAGWMLDRANQAANTNYANAQNQLWASKQNLNEQLWGQLRGGALGAAGTLIGADIGTAMEYNNPAYLGGAHADTSAASRMGQSAMSGATSALLGSLGTLNSIYTTGQTGANSIAAAQVNADNNNALADYVNLGDYQNRIAGIDATVQDAALTPPSTSGQTGGNGFMWKNGLVDIYVTYKTLSGASRRTVADYFRRYGYAIRRFLELGTPSHMLCMTKFAYWKVQETTITCAYANESEREAIRGVFEKGVTLWDSPASIGNTALTENQPKSGYSY